MIFVGGAPFSSLSSSASSSSSSSQADEELIGLLKHPLLVSASNSFKAIPERKVSLFEDSSMARTTRTKHVYVFQREYATVHPALVEFVGTDEATTCVGLVIRDRQTGITSIAHMDSPKVVDIGLNQMLSSLIDHNLGVEIDVHLQINDRSGSESDSESDAGSESDSESVDHSFPLCSKIIEALQKSQEKFHIQTLCVLGHNTRRENGAIAYPVFNGLLVETCSGSVKPASFDNSSRCPDELVRRIRVTVSSEDPNWKGRLLETYDTRNDFFRIAPCTWSYRWKYIALSLQELSDSEFLQSCSTSPSAEAPDFVNNERRVFQFLIENPDWRKTFGMKKPRVFRRTSDGAWMRDVE